MSLESAVNQYEQTNAKLVEEVVDLKSSYRASAAAANNLFETVASGLNNTQNGDYFSVPGEGNYLTLYKRVSGNAQAVATYPKADAVEQAGLDAASVAADRSAVESSATQVAADAASAVAAKAAAEAARDQAVAIADPEEAIEAAFDIWIKDKEREQFEAATGGACTIERTAEGDAAHMFIIPKLKWEELVPSGELGTGVHEAFLENGVEKSELLIGMYQAASMTGSGASSTRLTSQPGLVPRRSINWDASVSAAQAAGLTLMSNWEWSAIAFWCMANGFQPRGNTSNGKSHSHPHEQGRNVEFDNTETGSGPVAWRHNQAAQGIADLVGNVWEWQWGFKMVDGRIFLAPDNDKSLVESAWVDTEWDMPSASSSNWANFYSAENEAPLDVRRALIMPNGVADPDGSVWTNLEGERFPSRGGSRYHGGNAGLGALSLGNERTLAYISRGLRFSRLV